MLELKHSTGIFLNGFSSAIAVYNTKIKRGNLKMDEIQYQCQDCREWLVGEDENKNLVCKDCQEKRG